MDNRLLWNNVYEGLQIALNDIPKDGIFDYSHLLEGHEIDKKFTTINIRNSGEEVGLQQIVQKQLELLRKEDIITECPKKTINKETKGYFLKDKLKEAIKRINYDSIKKDISVADKNEPINNDEKLYEEVVAHVTTEIIKRALGIMEKPDGRDEKKGVKLYNFYFKIHEIEYNNIVFKISLIDTNGNFENNEITIIRERNLLVRNNQKGNNQEEYVREIPDFAVFFNGLPFIVVELKRQYIDNQSGEYKAHSDYMEKESYHNFLSCIGSNGNHTFISSNPSYNSFYLWKEYDNTPRTEPNGLYDIIIDLLIDPKKFLFYFESCTMPSETTQQYLKNARIQQFKTAFTIFKSLQDRDEKRKKIEEPEKIPLLKCYFQHHARTGKTFTFKIIAKMMYQKKVGGFKKIIFFVPDTASVLPSIQKEFKNIYFPNNICPQNYNGLYGNVHIIESRQDYIDSLKAQGKEFYFYIVNMQKIVNINGDTDGIIDKGDDVMVFIDEVHTFQKVKNEKDGKIRPDYQTLAEKRNQHFPNASFISATASPLMKIDDDGNYIDITQEMYGECIDILTPQSAIDLKLVTPLIYTKVNIDIEQDFIEKLTRDNNINNENIKQTMGLINNHKLDYLVKIEEKNKIKLTQHVKDEFLNKVFNFPNMMINSIPKNDTDDYENMKRLISFVQNMIKNDMVRKVGYYNSELDRIIWEALIKYKVDQCVVPIVNKQREKYNELGFMPKFFYMVPSKSQYSSIAPGNLMINNIQAMIEEYTTNNPDYNPELFNKELTIYNGVRFAFYGAGNNLVEECDQTNLTQFNDDEIKNNDRQGKDKPIDVLILVRKLTRGYDNANLIDIFLDRILGPDSFQEMLQMSTRGTTMREGKEASRLYDLTGSDSNFALYTETMSIYNREGENIIFSNDVINEIIVKTENHINTFIEYLLKNEYIHKKDNLTLLQIFLEADKKDDVSDFINELMESDNDNLIKALKTCMDSISHELKIIPFSIHNFIIDAGKYELSSVFMKLLRVYNNYNIERIKTNRIRVNTSYCKAVEQILLQVFPDINGLEGIRECINANLKATITQNEDSNNQEESNCSKTGDIDKQNSDHAKKDNNYLPKMKSPGDVIQHRYASMLNHTNTTNTAEERTQMIG